MAMAMTPPPTTTIRNAHRIKKGVREMEEPKGDNKYEEDKGLRKEKGDNTRRKYEDP